MEKFLCYQMTNKWQHFFSIYSRNFVLQKHSNIIPIKQNAALRREASAASHRVETYIPISPRFPSLKL